MEQRINIQVDDLVMKKFIEKGWCYDKDTYEQAKKIPEFNWSSFSEEAKPEAIKIVTEYLILMEKTDMERWIQDMLDILILEKFKQNGWCNDYSSYLTAKKDPGVTWSAFATQLKPKAIKMITEKKELKEKKYEQKKSIDLKLKKEKFDYLTMQDIDALRTPLNHSTIEKALEELNVEILKRIVREKYPDKFA
jgi:hypothetical protein